MSGELKMAVSMSDIENLDTDVLREHMVKGIYMLETVLFNQASYECSRVSKSRRHVEKMEDDLFSDGTQAIMDIDQKINLYRLASSNATGRMKFLQDLHDKITSGIEAMNSIETLKSRAKVRDLVDDENTSAGISEVKQLILSEIKTRVEMEKRK